MPSKTKNKKLREYFKIQKWKWYLVDLRDYHKPVLVRKHLDSKLQAIQFKEKYYDKNYDIIYYKEARKYNLRDLGRKKHHKKDTAKYNYPNNCITQYQKQLFRNNERKKNRQIMRLPKVTEKAIWEIMDDSPIRFMRNLRKFSSTHWALTEPVEGLKKFKRKYNSYKDINNLCNIVRLLKKDYDVGMYDVANVAIFIYRRWNQRVKRHLDGLRAIPKTKYMDKIVKEFKARGFIETPSRTNIAPFSPCVMSVNIKPHLYYPVKAWHNGKDKKEGVPYIYDLQVEVGIPGYTKSYT